MTHFLYFLLISLVTALATTAIRLRDPVRIARETTRFFVTIVVGIVLFCGVVYVLEWVFVRPLLG